MTLPGTLRPHARFRAHTHMRPLFRCRACGANWPCSAARLALLVIYRDNLSGLRDCLTGRLMIAMSDQPWADPVALARRFLEWVPTDDP